MELRAGGQQKNPKSEQQNGNSRMELRVGGRQKNQSFKVEDEQRCGVAVFHFFQKSTKEQRQPLWANIQKNRPFQS